MDKKKKKIDEILSLSVETIKYVSFVDYYLHIPLFTLLRVNNDGADSLYNFEISVTNENGMILPCVKTIDELPFESSVEVNIGDIVSPLYFADLNEIKEEKLVIELLQDKKSVTRVEVCVTVLPFEFWQGIGGNEETLASFVRPKLGDCSRLRTEMRGQLKKWNVSDDWHGYDNSDKNIVRKVIASLFTVLRHYSFTKKTCDITKPVEAGAGVKLLNDRNASELEMALLVASTIESVGLNPIIIYGENGITCGVWLYDSCFSDTVSDDTERLEGYISDGINGLSCFEIGDLFSDKTVAYSTSENHFAQKLSLGEYDRILDIHRARLNRITPLPLRNKTVNGYEILSENETSPDEAPKDLFLKGDLRLDGKLTRDKQWERRLLDLSMKNALLSFSPKGNAIQIVASDVDMVLNTILASPIKLAPIDLNAFHIADRSTPYGLTKAVGGMKELLAEDMSGGIFRTYECGDALDDILEKLRRKNKVADEESGTKILYLALGILKWYTKAGEEKYAPLVLQPVELKFGKGRTTYELVAGDEEYAINATLLEFLKQEFNVDIRGLDGKLQGLKISEILAMVRMEIVEMKGWAVYDDCFVAAFSFSRYQMWQDVRKNIGEFSKNSIIAAMLGNKVYNDSIAEVAEKKEDETSMTEVLMPLWADSSQWEAIALSKTGSTFVLHGPPGTGKSQTITNIICNALHDGKRVLFVAEKQAALSVVKKRLDATGVGEFCLELHSDKTNKSEVLQKLSSVLASAGSGEESSVYEKSERIAELKGSLYQPLDALHKKRRLGVSVYEAMLICFENADAPDVMNIESVFYDKLTCEKIERYEKLIRRAAVSAKECGGVYNSPFSNVYLTKYSKVVRNAVFCSAEVIIAEIKHLKSYLTLFLDLYRQRISRLTRKKLKSLECLVQMLSNGSLNEYFNEDEEQFHAFFNANRRLDINLTAYFKRFKKLIEVKKDERRELSEFLHSDSDFSKFKTVNDIVKKLSKVSIGTLSDDARLPSLELLSGIAEDMEVIKNSTKLSQNFSSAFGKIDFIDGRKKYLEKLYKLHELAAEVFVDYNADSFNGVCIESQSGYASPVNDGLLRSLSCFASAERAFNNTIKADENKIPENDILEQYVAQAGALIENIDMLANWCSYRSDAEELKHEGLTFITDALENGGVNADNVIASFEKNIYKNFLQTTIQLDPVLARFSQALQEENTEALRYALDEYAVLCRKQLRYELIARLPMASTEGKCSIELMNFSRFAKNNLRGMSVRKLFDEIPELLKSIAPCMLMSPATVAQYLRPENGLFDLVIFDEASQMPTAEAIGSLARGKAAIIVGDPKQLPPTSFFSANYVDEENIENEDMESVLDDCLSLGVKQRHLTWHYRSKHESLIAFSNNMYYGNKLCTFPSPDAPDSHVRFNLVEDGVYDRGFTKRNKAEAEALVKDVIRRLKDPALSHSSIGIVTFSNVQRDYIDRKLSAEILAAGLEEKAYGVEEPIFVKNLENVQGDERDVILFSVCYGPDKNGRISLNFGPLNQAGGWRRLNVAASRAREEMVVFSSIRGAMIDLSKTNSKGVAGLKAFLEFAEKGKTTLAISSDSLSAKKVGIGKYIAEALSQYGYDCRYDVGASDFKIDVAVLDPKNKHRYILAIMCDSTERFSVKDRNVLQLQTLKRNNWNVTRVYAVNYYSNPKREIKRLKDLLDKITGRCKHLGSGINKAQKLYKYAKLSQEFENASYVTSGENDTEIISRIKAIVGAEEPISEDFLIRRTLATLGIVKYGTRVESRMHALIALCGLKHEKAVGAMFYRKSEKPFDFDKYRVENSDNVLRKAETDFTPYEIIALIRAALEDKVALYAEEILNIVCVIMHIGRPSDKFAIYINECITFGEEKGLFVRSVSDRISLA